MRDRLRRGRREQARSADLPPRARRDGRRRGRRVVRRRHAGHRRGRRARGRAVADRDGPVRLPARRRLRPVTSLAEVAAAASAS